MTILLSDSGVSFSMTEGCFSLLGNVVSLDGFTMLWKVCKGCAPAADIKRMLHVIDVAIVFSNVKWRHIRKLKKRDTLPNYSWKRYVAKTDIL